MTLGLGFHIPAVAEAVSALLTSEMVGRVDKNYRATEKTDARYSEAFYQNWACAHTGYLDQQMREKKEAESSHVATKKKTLGDAPELENDAR